MEARGGASAGCADIPWNDVAGALGLGDTEQQPAVTEAMLRYDLWRLGTRTCTCPWPGFCWSFAECVRQLACLRGQELRAARA